jgi:GT2 family glycosyltransferase
MNWSHHYDERQFSNIEFETNEISEGAVVFRKSVLDTVGIYFEKYFISHEGPDLACRILDSGSKIIYSPKIVVEHHHSDIGRKSWRRYYYDTRNLIWLNVRHFPATMAIKRILFGLCPMLIYSVRDGFVFYWLKGVKDALVGLKEVVAGRKVISSSTMEYIKKIESNRPNLIVIMKKRFFRKDVRI